MRDLWRRLAPLYGEREARAVVAFALEALYGLTTADIYGGTSPLPPAAELEAVMQRLSSGEPVQYVVGTAWFGGRRFAVGPGVLIPRPETEELCRWVTATAASPAAGGQPLRLLDIGTGSGCIAITLALDIAGAHVTACDLSPVALATARSNARALGAKVSFVQCDMLRAELPAGTQDIIVSNPPYIMNKEKATMECNVLDHEPHEALFVPDDDPLRFYRAIACTARTALSPGGVLFLETNPLTTDMLEAMLRRSGFVDIVIRRDSYGRRRLMSCRQPGDHPVLTTPPCVA